MLRPISRGIFSRANNALQSALCSILVKLLSLEKNIISFLCLSLFRVWSSIGNYFMPQELFYKSGTAFKNQLKIFNSYIPCILNAIEDLKFTPDFVQIIFKFTVANLLKSNILTEVVPERKLLQLNKNKQKEKLSITWTFSWKFGVVICSKAWMRL